jgi:cation diffusion facilitator CzcD-associated flavoprotein CzcO
VDYAGKKVGLIGIGSSGIQLTPKIQKGIFSQCRLRNAGADIVTVAAKLEVFARSPVWITPQLGGLTSAENTPTPDEPKITELLLRGQQPFDFSEEEKQMFEQDPEFLLRFRRGMELSICEALDYCKIGSPTQVALFKLCKENMERLLGDNEELKAHIIPKFAVGCRRPTPGAGFLEALVTPNTKAIFTPIQEVVETGIKTVDGELHEMDVLVCATGFNIGFCPFFEVRGKGGVKLIDSWDPEPK